MANIEESLERVMSVEGAVGAALVDSSSGFVLGKVGDGVDMDAAGADGTAVVRAKSKTMKALNLDDMIEDILITKGEHYHIIRPVAREPDLFIYLILEKARSNLAIARMSTANVEGDIFD